jgi:hypothetical protein
MARSPTTAERTGCRTDSGAARYRIRRGDGAAEQSRNFIFLLSTLMQRYDRLRREAFGSDLDFARIVDAVSVAGIEDLMGDAEWRRQYAALSTVVGAAQQRGANSMSISRATGIPRETARRKIKKLIETGVLTETAQGEYVVTPGYLQQVADPARFEAILADTIRFINGGLDHDVYAWSDASSPED